MLNEAIKKQVESVFQNLQNEYTFDVSVDPQHADKNVLTDLLDGVASCSEKVQLQIKDGNGLSFGILKNGEPTNILFRAVPNGHEFTTLLLAVLNLDGTGKNLPDEVISKRIKALNGPISLKTYISLTCTNCPDVVQALNIISFLNPEVHHEIIDGALYKEEAEKANVQAVPSVFADGEVLHVGRSSLGELLGKLESKYGSKAIDVDNEIKKYDVIVVGGGPAGVAAAVYSARKGLSVAIVAGVVGGQVTETQAIENMISIPMTTGSELAANLKQHLNEYAIDIMENRFVESVSVENGKKVLQTSLGEILETPALIIATGASWRRLGVPGEDKFIGNGVAFCTHCDGPFYKDKKVVVVGGGNSGLEAAIDLSSIASEVTVLEYLDSLKGDQVLQNKLHSLSNVSVITSAQTMEIRGNGKVSSLEFKHRDSGESKTINTDGVFVQIGLVPNSKVFSDVVKTNNMGEIEIDAHCRTSTPGIYAAGDVTEVPFKQIVIAMGEGSKAALSAFEDKIKGVI